MSKTSNSILLLCSARETLADIVKISSVQEKTEIINHIMNEASDYEIMHLLMRGDIPSSSEDVLGEMELFEEFSQLISENADAVSEAIGYQSTHELINEIGPISVYGISSRLPTLELVREMGESVLNEAIDLNKAVAMGRSLASKFTKDPAKIEKMARQFNNAAHKMNQAGKSAGEALAAAKASMSEKWGEMLKQGAQKAKDVGSSIVRATGGTGGLADKTGLSRQTMGIGAGVAAAAAAAAAIYGGYKVYKRFFSQAAKACSGKSGGEKTACMAGFKKKALQAQIATVNKGMSACAKSKNPEKCKAVIANKVNKLKGQMAKI